MTKAQTKLQNGFTITELIIVIVIIGILVALIVNSFSTVQAKERDTDRQTEINNIATALESCYNTECNSSYPTLSQLQDDGKDGWVSKFMPDFDTSNLYDSGSTKIQGANVSITEQYKYDPRKADGSRCTGEQDKCTSFTLTTYQELDPNNPYVKKSLNN